MIPLIRIVVTAKGRELREIVVWDKINQFTVWLNTIDVNDFSTLFMVYIFFKITPMKISFISRSFINILFTIYNFYLYGSVSTCES